MRRLLTIGACLWLFVTTSLAQKVEYRDGVIAIEGSNVPWLLKTGLNFPKFEVNYEQSIIAPAASTASRPTMPMPTPTTRTGH